MVHLSNVEQLYLKAQKFTACFVSMVQISQTVLVLINVNLVESVQVNMNMYLTNARVKVMSSVIAKQGFIGTRQMINVFPVVPAQAAWGIKTSLQNVRRIKVNSRWQGLLLLRTVHHQSHP